MRRALVLARRGWGTTQPNPLVGAIVLDSKEKQIGAGFHERAGGLHAEKIAFDQAGERARGGTLFVTLEPCVGFEGKRTGACVERVISSGVRRVVISSLDPNLPVNGKGVAALQKAGIEVSVGCLSEISDFLNLPFRTFVTEQRPFIVAKSALSMDGKIGARGQRVHLTGEVSLRRTMHLRAGAGAILAGSETILSDDPILNVRGRNSDRKPIRAILDPELVTPPTARILNLDGGPVWIFTKKGQENTEQMKLLKARGARGVFLETGDDGLFGVREVVAFFAAEKITSILIEGGANTISHFAAAGLIDRFVFFLSPKRLGANLDAAPTVPLDLGSGVALEILSVIRRGADWQVVAIPKKGQ
ncbi:MAG: bifunctional diaminohydroxyphosphoribosylaminopyrimidine deaminase/5-amino-6-(5-phosphoribosylamino)uracil reductase RibD [Pseudomonadota bacterium]